MSVSKKYLKARQAFRFKNFMLSPTVSYGEAHDDWQEECIHGPIDESKYLGYYIQLPRGSGKTTSVAWIAIEQVVIGEEGQRVILAAADKEQAGLIVDAAKRIIRNNPALAKAIRVTKNGIYYDDRDSYAELITSDAKTNFGHRPSLVIIDELHAHRNLDLYEALASSTGKVPGCKIIILTNAPPGQKNPAWKVRETAVHSPKYWYVYWPDGQVASWITPEWIEAQKEILTHSAFERLIMNRDCADDNAFLTVEQISEATIPDLEPIGRIPNGIVDVAVGVDFATKHDAAVICAVGKRDLDAGSPTYVLLNMDVIPGDEKNQIQVVDMEDLILRYNTMYEKPVILIDPWGMRSTLQRFENHLAVEEFRFTSQTVVAITKILYSAIANQDVVLYPNAGGEVQGRRRDEWTLQRELQEAVIIEANYGQRVDHKKSGYTDRIMAMGMAIWYLSQQDEPYSIPFPSLVAGI